MFKKNPFSFFVRSKERGSKTSTGNRLESIVKNKKNCIYVPKEAFSSIYDLEEYSYLKNGLYVGESKLAVHDFPNELRDLSGPFYEIQDWMTLSWYDAKRLTKAMGGKLMTPSEYVCSVEYIKKQCYQDVYLDMTIHGLEWLDSMLVIKADPYAKKIHKIQCVTHSDLDKNIIVGGTKKDVSLPHEPGYFSKEMMDVKTGYPSDLTEDEKEFIFKGLAFEYEPSHKMFVTSKSPLTMTRAITFRSYKAMNNQNTGSPHPTIDPNADPFLNLLIGMRMNYEVKDEDFI